MMDSDTRENKIETVRRLTEVAKVDPQVQDPADIWIVPFTVEEVERVYPRTPDQRTCTPDAVTRILNNLANTGVIYQACLGTGMSCPSFERVKKDNPGLQGLVLTAKQIYSEKVQHTVHCRAINGWIEPVYYKGEWCGNKRVFSERLLELQAKKVCPDYRDKSSVDVNVSGGVLVVHSTAMTKEEWLAKHTKRVQSIEAASD